MKNRFLTMRRIKRISILLLLILLCFLPYILWLNTAKRPFRVFIMDKTVMNKKGQEHRSFDWVLMNKRFCKPDSAFYTVANDYYGFFPLKDKQFTVRDLSSLDNDKLDALADKLDMLYYTDSYGIYSNEWYREKDQTEHSSKVYGGLDKHDYALIKKMKDRNKLIVAEFNFFASPTSDEVRTLTEKDLGIRWTGWTGRFFDDLDTLTNAELPRWVYRLYMQQHHGQWPFHHSGIVFVHQNSTIAILEETKDTQYGLPQILSNYSVQEKYDVIDNIDYPYWFDITLPTDGKKEVISSYQIATTAHGDSILHHHGIPSVFPAVIKEKTDNRFYYFAGDFADNVINNFFLRWKWGDKFESFFQMPGDDTDRSRFFTDYYYPLMSKILDDYYLTIKKR